MASTCLTWYPVVGLLSGWLVAAGLVGSSACGEENETPAAVRSPATSDRRGTEPKGVITLSQALTAALRNNPDIESVTAEIKAQEARAVQAGLLPNPEIGIEVENFGGSGDVSGFDATETTVRMSHARTGEKKAKRIAGCVDGTANRLKGIMSPNEQTCSLRCKRPLWGCCLLGAGLPGKGARHPCGAGPPNCLRAGEGRKGLPC